MRLYRKVLMSTCVASAVVCYGSDSTKVNLMPNFNITLKTRFEQDLDNDEGRFQVRNARFGISGDVLPEINYKIEADFCDRGKIKVLDAWAGIRPVCNLNVMLGQVKIPFSVDRARAVYKYYFADYSYIGRMIGGIRGVGLKLNYMLPKVPLELYGMVYNTYSITEHEVWEKKMSYAAEARYQLGWFTPAISFMSNVPDSVRINNLAAALIFDCGRWHAEAEYMMRHYTCHRFDTSHAYSVFANYTLPLSRGFFNRLSFQARLDGMNGYSDGTRSTTGLLTLAESKSHRLTVGSTIAHIKGGVTTHLRLDYYHVFRPSGDIAPQGEGNKLVAEMVLRF